MICRMEINTLILVNFQEESRKLTINAIIKKCSHNPDKLTIHALYDGDIIEPWETVMTIKGDLADFLTWKQCTSTAYQTN